jgi:hypothetical protein
MTKLIIALFIALVSVSSAFPDIYGDCGDLSAMRSDFVKESFDITKTIGMWYEVAYHDLAQVKSSCPYYNRAVDEDGISSHFGLTYSNKNKTVGINTMYQTTDDTGIFTQYADYPIIKKMNWPTVVVDVSVDDAGNYDYLIEYSCWQIGKVKYTDIHVGSRSKELSTKQYLKIENSLRKAGVDLVSMVLIKADHDDSCSYPIDN